MLQLMLMLVTAMTGTVTTPAAHSGVVPAIVNTDGGGPDAYGYRWIDSDTTGGPTFRWRSIRTVGTRVFGLQDDNVVGPFPIGFQFPYYWYRVSNFYVGSNGHVGLGPEGNGFYAAAFPNLPDAANPNNTIAPFMFDLIHNDNPTPAKVYYWTSANLDTCIVEYDSVRYWGQAGNSGANSFQVVLTKSDSSIRFQYLHVDVPPLGWGDITEGSTIGIENMTGAIGLSYLHDSIPAGNLPHDGLAIRFYPPATTPYQVHDMSTYRVMNDINGGFFLVNGSPTRFWAKTKNTGNQTEATLPVYCFLRDSAGALLFADTVTLTSVPAGRVDSIAFPKTWTPAINNVYTLRIITNLSGDMLRSNDTVASECRVITYPAELGYDRSALTGSIYWLGSQGGMGNHFNPPQYPLQVMGIKAHMQASPVVGCTMWLFSEVAGAPGTVLGRGTVNVGAVGWYEVDFNPPVTINSGGFFVGVTSDANQAPSYSYDSVPPISRQSWEYTGGWAPNRDMTRRDMMIRAIVRAPLTVDLSADYVRNPTAVVAPGASVAPIVRVRNLGSAAQSSIPVFCWIDSMGSRIYNRSCTLAGPLAAYDTARVTFPVWTAGPQGNAYQMTFFTDKTGDLYRPNDTVKLTTAAFTIQDTLIAKWATVKPTLDGNIQTDEWADANKYDISDVMGQGGTARVPGSCFLYVKHDSGNVYYGVDMPVVLVRATNQQCGFYVDENNDNTWNTDSSEGNHWSLILGSYDTVRYRGIVPGPGFSSTRTNPGLGHMKQSVTSGHWQMETSIQKGAQLWNYSVGTLADTIGFFMYAQDTTNRRYGHWPTWLSSAAFADPAQYGTALLLPKVPPILPDVGTVSLDYPTGSIDSSVVILPRAKVKNYGTIPAAFTATFDIFSGGTPVYTQTVSFNLAPGAESTHTFPEWAKPHTPGAFATRCSCYCLGDTVRTNDVKTGSFTITAAPPVTPGWYPMPDLPLGAKGKKVKDGGCLAYNEESDTGFVYALKGNGRYEFYKYNTGSNVWVAKESIPAIGRLGKKKPVKKGAALCELDDMPNGCRGRIWAAKGNNSLEWWCYDPALSGTPTYPWAQKADIPAGAKNVKEGTGAVAVRVSDTTYIFFLRGSSGQEFLRYNEITDVWTAMTPAPLGASGKPFKDGSCLGYCDDDSIVYALKGSYNEFYAYDVATNAWTTKAPLPLIGSSGKKKKAKSGAGMAYHDKKLYTLKGNGTYEFWQYQCDSDRWAQGTDIPSGTGKAVKGGGSIVHAELPYPSFYAFKGNNTSEYWKYVPASFYIASAGSAKSNQMLSSTAPITSYELTTSPNPFTGALVVSFALPRAGNVSVRVYDVSGRTVATLSQGYASEGRYTAHFNATTLARGIYVLKFESGYYSQTRKLILQ